MKTYMFSASITMWRGVEFINLWNKWNKIFPFRWNV